MRMIGHCLLAHGSTWPGWTVPVTESPLTGVAWRFAERQGQENLGETVGGLLIGFGDAPQTRATLLCSSPATWTWINVWG